MLVRPEMRVLYMSGYTDEAIAQDGMFDERAPSSSTPFKPNAPAGRACGSLDVHVGPESILV